MRVLGHERSAAEAYAMLLDTHGKQDMNRYVEGIRLYSEAKADFDGLLEQLKYNLNEGHDPNNSATVRSSARGRGSKADRVYRFVTQNILGDVQGARPGLPDLISAVPDLVKVLIDAGFNIWKEFQAGE